MTIPPGSIAPADSLVTPLAEALGTVAQQIQGVSLVYTTPPDGAPEDGSVLIVLREWEVEGDTNYKLRVNLVFEVLHLFLRNDLSQALANAYPYVPAWFTVLTAASNNELGGLAITVSLLTHKGSVKGFEWAGDPYIAISNMVGVLTEFPIHN